MRFVHENTIRMIFMSVAAMFSVAGCSGPSRSPYADHSDAARNSLRAQQLTMEAVDVMNTDAQRAQSMLRQALQADLFYGPAHNNLAVLYLREDKVYDAANEFEWARKLMPGNPDPRMNLALTLEKAGRIDEALLGYKSALEACPEHLPSIQAITRLQIRYRRTDDQTNERLKHIALAGETPRWRQWATEQLAKSMPK